MEHSGYKPECWSQTTWVQIPPLPLLTVMSGKFLNLCFQFPCLNSKEGDQILSEVLLSPDMIVLLFKKYKNDDCTY